jgi:hypothetical protein
MEHVKKSFAFLTDASTWGEGELPPLKDFLKIKKIFKMF